MHVYILMIQVFLVWRDDDSLLRRRYDTSVNQLGYIRTYIPVADGDLV